MKNKYNRNLVNQYNNSDFYEPELFDFILDKTDLNELKNHQFDISYHHTEYVKGNFEAWLKKGIEYTNAEKSMMHDKIHEKYHHDLLTPLYFISLNKKEYVLEQAGYEIFKDINQYIRSLSQQKVKALNDNEEKFVIDWFFKGPPSIYIKKEDTAEVHELYKLLYNQKDYLNKKNDKSVINNFFENRAMKNIFSLMTIEQRNSLMNEPITYQQIIKKYYSQLLRQKHFDLAHQLSLFSAQDIVSSLKEQVSTNEQEWFKVFLEKGTSLTLNNLQKKLENQYVPPPIKEKLKETTALKGGIDLLKKLLPEIKNSHIVTLFLVACVEAQNETCYKQLRSFVELPIDEKLQDYINRKDIHKKSIDQIEKEILKDKLENKYVSREKTKQPKI